MKFKVIIALLLAVTMLVTIALPALADAARGTLTAKNGATGTGTASIRTTNTDTLIVTVTLKGAATSYLYNVGVHNETLGESEIIGSFRTDVNGDGKFTGTSSPWSAGQTDFDVALFDIVNTRFQTGTLTVTLK